MNDTHLMAMKNSLQNLLYAVASGKKRKEKERKLLLKYRGIYWPHWTSTSDYVDPFWPVKCTHSSFFCFAYCNNKKAIFCFTKVNVMQSDENAKMAVLDSCAKFVSYLALVKARTLNFGLFKLVWHYLCNAFIHRVSLCYADDSPPTWHLLRCNIPWQQCLQTAHHPLLWTRRQESALVEGLIIILL